MRHNSFLWLGNVLGLSAWVTFFWWLTNSPHWTTVFSQLNVFLWAIFGLGILFFLLSQLSLAWKAPMHGSPEKQKFLTHLFAICLPLLLFWSLYHQVLSAWWKFDDPDILQYVDAIGAVAGFFDPSNKYNFYTPLQHLSLGIDYGLFGLNPAGFYWHHLLSMSTVILLAYAVLARFFAPLLASMIVSLFVVSVPTAQVTHYLMVRHYVEGLALSLIAVLAYMQAVRQERWAWAGLGSVFYLLATMAKELYVPLVVALAWLPIGTFKTRTRLLIPYAVVAVLYTILRIYMLGEDVLSGYPEQTTTWQDILKFPATFLNVMGMHALWQWLPVLGIIIAFGMAVWRKPFSLGLYSLVWFGMASIPLIPIMWRMSVLYYYSFVIGLLFCVGCGIAFNYIGGLLSHYPWRNVMITVWFLALLLANLLPVQTEQLRLHNVMQARKTQGEFLMYSNSPSTVLIYDYHVANSLIYLRENVLGRKEGVHWCPKLDCRCAIHYPGFTAKQYVNGQWQTKTLSPAECGNAQKELSVTVTLTPPNKVTWHFGPYSQNQGQYYVSILLPDNEALSSNPAFYKLPPQGTHTFHQPLLNPFKLVVKYESSEGWETYSPLLVLEPKQVNDQGLVELVWQR